MKRSPRLHRALLLAAALTLLLCLPARAFTVPEPTELFYAADFANVLEQSTIDDIVTRNDSLYARLRLHPVQRLGHWRQGQEQRPAVAAGHWGR